MLREFGLESVSKRNFQFSDGGVLALFFCPLLINVFHVVAESIVCKVHFARDTVQLVGVLRVVLGRPFGFFVE